MDTGRRLRGPQAGGKGTGDVTLVVLGAGVRGDQDLRAQPAGPLSTLAVSILFPRTQALPPSTCCLGELSGRG